jgi:8-oxo-dGTP pyrophosphatase MutT (NUDIX family)
MTSSNNQMHEVSAGGIVFFGDRVLVLRNHRGDAVFPKGHLEPGETQAEAAMREVWEEAGIRPAIVCALGSTQYRYFWIGEGQYRLKTVHWFLMEAGDDNLAVDGHEITSGEYLPTDKAAEVLTYRLDKEKLAVALRRRQEIRQT